MIHEVEDTYLLTYLLTTHEVEDPTVGIPLAHISIRIAQPVSPGLARAPGISPGLGSRTPLE